MYLSVFFLSSFFQAEDGIRDGHVTGVQTCALPICHDRSNTRSSCRTDDVRSKTCFMVRRDETEFRTFQRSGKSGKIGRASCRERGKMLVVAAGEITTKAVCCVVVRCQSSIRGQVSE